MIIHRMTNLPDGITPLTHLGVIRVQGDDAIKFLQGQLTQDFELVTGSQARLAAFCSAKGRMQASFIGIVAGPGDVLLVCSRDILAPTLKRLSMFVMRAKATLSDATAEFKLYGLAGAALAPWIAPDSAPWARATVGAVHAVRLYNADAQPRALWIAPASEPEPQGAAISLPLWHWGEVRSGVATITAPIVEAFVPQMLNYESVGGVNFKKGCYPGQEVVARSQFRGTLKRRAYVGHTLGEPVVGQEVFQAPAPQPVGMVVQAAAAPQGGFEVIVSLQTAAAAEAVAAGEAAPLRLGSTEGAPLQLQPLPYALLEDI